MYPIRRYPMFTRYTQGLLPLEIIEIFAKPDLLRIGLLISNILILVYLIYLRIKNTRNKRRGSPAH